jgi:hypothetical protein
MRLASRIAAGAEPDASKRAELLDLCMTCWRQAQIPAPVAGYRGSCLTCPGNPTALNCILGQKPDSAPTRWAAARIAKMTTASDANHNELSDHATTLETVERRKRIEHQDRAFVAQLRAAIMCGRETPAGVLGYEHGPRRPPPR